MGAEITTLLGSPSKTCSRSLSLEGQPGPHPPIPSSDVQTLIPCIDHFLLYKVCLFLYANPHGYTSEIKKSKCFTHLQGSCYHTDVILCYSVSLSFHTSYSSLIFLRLLDWLFPLPGKLYAQLPAWLTPSFLLELVFKYQLHGRHP